MNSAIVTGAAGFAGLNLVERLLENGYKVYGIVRPGSQNNSRLPQNPNFIKVELEAEDYALIAEQIPESCVYFYHMTWSGRGGRNNFEEQIKNIDYTLDALRSAAKLGCRKFIGTGSQAEYGVKLELITEDLCLEPFCAYGAAKVAACQLSKNLAKQLGIEWCWGRIFSLYGKYEPSGRMLPDLIEKLKDNEEVHLSSCRQMWDYLDAVDGAEAFIAIGERGHDGEIYNVANGDYHELKWFTEAMKRSLHSSSNIIYGDDPNPFVSLQPSVTKIAEHTGWKARVQF